MRRILAAMVMLCAFGAGAETPQEAATTMLELLKAKNYDVLFKQRYSEWHKLEGTGMVPAAAIKKLSSIWERNYDMMVKVFEQLASAEYEMSKSDTPQKTETGDVATTTVSMAGKDVPYKLYKMKSGLWGFHM